MNTKRMRALMKLIAAEPRRMRMEGIAERAGDLALPENEQPPCGTVMCIAGTAVLAEEREQGFYRKRFGAAFLERLNHYAIGDAKQWLELTGNEGRRLFMLSQHVYPGTACWPPAFEARYKAAKTPKQRTAVVLARMRHFLATKGAE